MHLLSWLILLSSSISRSVPAQLVRLHYRRSSTSRPSTINLILPCLKPEYWSCKHSRIVQIPQDTARFQASDPASPSCIGKLSTNRRVRSRSTNQPGVACIASPRLDGTVMLSPLRSFSMMKSGRMFRGRSSTQCFASFVRANPRIHPGTKAFPRP